MAPRVALLSRQDLSALHGTVTKPGFYRMSGKRYHADPCPQPSVSAGFLTTLIQKSPAHARVAHPRLNPRWRERAPTPAMLKGSLLHHLLLGHGNEPAIFDEFDDWKSDLAKRCYTEALEADMIPVLGREWIGILRIAAGIRRELRHTEGVPDDIDQGFPEATLVWREGPIWCRCRVDWLAPIRPFAEMTDLKFTGRDGESETIARRTGELGYAIRQAHYRRGFEKVFGIEPGPYVYLTGETYEPTAVSRTAVGPEWQALGEEQWRWGMEIATACMLSNTWPAYPRKLEWTVMPAYAVRTWEQQAARAAAQLEGTLAGALLPSVRRGDFNRSDVIDHDPQDSSQELTP